RRLVSTLTTAAPTPPCADLARDPPPQQPEITTMAPQRTTAATHRPALELPRSVDDTVNMLRPPGDCRADVSTSRPCRSAGDLGQLRLDLARARVGHRRPVGEPHCGNGPVSAVDRPDEFRCTRVSFDVDLVVGDPVSFQHLLEPVAKAAP